MSLLVAILAGVFQGCVLSPVLFSIFIDDLILKVEKTDVGCYLSITWVSIFLFADEILLLSVKVLLLNLNGFANFV